MKVDVVQHIHRSPGDIYRLVSDMAYLLPRIDEGVVSVTKQIEGPLRAGTVWNETARGFGMTVRVKLELTGFDPGRSVDFSFDSRIMQGAGTATCAPNGTGTDFAISIDWAPKGAGRLLYPGLRWDFARRERRRMANLKRMVEAGELDPLEAETAPGL